MAMLNRRAWLCGSLTVFAGCDRPERKRPPHTGARGVAYGSPADAGELASVLIEQVPFVHQKPDFCGEACVEMAARRLGKQIDQDAVFAASGLSPAEGRGVFTKELVTALHALGFQPGPVWRGVDVASSDREIAGAFAELHADLVRGVPSIVCMRYDERPQASEHFRLVLGYDAPSDTVVYHEPAEKDGAYRRMPRAKLFALWPLKYEPRRWTVIRLSLSPLELKEPPRAAGSFTPADYAQHVMKLKELLLDKGLTGLAVRIEEPFVVVGNDPPALLAGRAETVSWARERLERDFFEKRPSRILNVFLWNDEKSYEHGVRALTGAEPGTPYGFYSSTHGGLFMNIATGGGTLVHEIVHPYVEADFPDAPAWLNEGLGSLFEQSRDRGGHIVGDTNWRLSGLQRAIKRGRVPSFEALTKTTAHEFYDEDPGTNYAQARYLFYFMQEQGKLIGFYKAFRAARTKDPTGYQTLKATLGEPDMSAFKARWEEYVLALRFPGA